MTSSRHTVSLADSIGTRLMMLVFAIYVIITAILTGIHMYVEFDNTRTTVTYELRALAKTLNQGLATAIYNVDNRQIRSILDGVMESPIIVGIRIETEYQGDFIAGEGPSHTAENDGTLLSFSDTILYSEPGSPSVPIGVLTLHSSRSVILGKVWHSLMLILINSVFKTFALWIIFLWMSRTMLSRPLSRLTAAAREIDLDKLDDFTVDAGTSGRNELKILEEAFNSMIEKLLRSRKQSERLTLSLRRAGEQLAEYNRTLEEKVRERTRELNRVLEEVQSSRRAAEIANKAKSDFLASMSHEIRTPLNAIIGISDVLADTELTQEQRQYVEIFRSSGETLLAIINDILDFSKIEAGQISLEAIPFGVEDVVQNACDVLATSAFDKGVELVCEIDPNLPRRIQGDPTRLRQVLSNLISNAIKFTTRGEIVVGAMHSAGPNPGEILFSVRDTGIGIPESKRRIIFEGFTQADSSTTRLFGGTGLGLAICSRLVSLMGGRIWLEDNPGGGALFQCTIPFALPSGPPAPPPLAMLDQTRALVVEPNGPCRRALVKDLEGLGARVAAVATLSEALGLYDPADPESGFDLVAAAESVLPHGGTASQPGLVRPEGQTLVLRKPHSELTDRTGGPDPAVIKPATRSKLLKVLTAAAAGDDQTAALPQTGQTPSLTLLLAEDQAYNRSLIQFYLQDTPHSLALAENGAQALQMFKNQRFDAVLMDMEMPVMDGYTATRQIREYEWRHNLERTPVIALTAHAFDEHVQKTAEAGCTDHLTKPIKKQTFLAAIRALCENLPPGAAASSHGLLPFTPEPDVQDGDIVVLERALEPLVLEFLEDVRQDIAAMRGALERADLEQVRVSGHSLKGAGGGYGFDAITEFGRLLEQAGRDGDADRAREHLDELQRYLDGVEVRYTD